MDSCSQFSLGIEKVGVWQASLESFSSLHKPGVLEFLQKSCKVKEVKDSLVATLFLADS